MVSSSSSRRLVAAVLQPGRWDLSLEVLSHVSTFGLGTTPPQRMEMFPLPSVLPSLLLQLVTMMMMHNSARRLPITVAGLASIRLYASCAEDS
jgi:hypothetical protein